MAWISEPMEQEPLLPGSAAATGGELPLAYIYQPLTIGKAVCVDGTAVRMGTRIRDLGAQGSRAADGVDRQPRPVRVVLSAALPRPPERDRARRAPRLEVRRSTASGTEFPDQELRRQFQVTVGQRSNRRRSPNRRCSNERGRGR